MIYLAQAAPPTAELGWPAALVAIVSMILPLAWALLELLKRKTAERQRDAVIEGVERQGDAPTKAAIKKTALERGVSLDSSVDKVTRRLAPLLLGALLLSLTACCVVDHAAIAQRAERQRDRMARAQLVTDEHLTPAGARGLFREEELAWEVVRARMGGAPVSSSSAAELGQ